MRTKSKYGASVDSYTVILLNFEKYNDGIKTINVESTRIFSIHQKLKEKYSMRLRDQLRNLKLSKFIPDTCHADILYGKNPGLRCDIRILEKIYLKNVLLFGIP